MNTLVRRAARPVTTRSFSAYSALYNVAFKSTARYSAFVVAGAIASEVAWGCFSQFLWNTKNDGVRYSFMLIFNPLIEIVPPN